VVNSEEVIGTTEYLPVRARCRYNWLQLCILRSDLTTYVVSKQLRVPFSMYVAGGRFSEKIPFLQCLLYKQAI
jgi:hypothetical protein